MQQHAETIKEVSSEGINLVPKGMNPVLFQNVYRLVSPVHAQNDYRLTRFSPAQKGIKVMDIDIGPLEGLKHGLKAARMIWNLSEEDWDIVIAVHLKGTFNTIRNAAPLMREQKYGRIVNTISEAFVGTVGHVNYGAAKGGIASLTYAVAWELGRYGVTCNAICLRAATRMTMGPDVLAGYKKRVESGLWTKEKYDEVTHVASADYLAAIPAYLATDKAGHINGCIFGAAGAFFSYWAPSKETAIYNRDWDTYGKWTIDEVEKCVPNLLKGYVNPAPPEEKKEEK